jgi:uncharacterized membrane protein
MVLGTLSAFAAFFTGEYFSKNLIGPAGDMKETHELFAKTTMYLMLGASALRIYLMLAKKDQGWGKWLVFVLYAIGAGLVSYTGYLGGSLVYDYML